MKWIVLAVALLATPAFAQQRPPTAAELQGIVVGLSAQIDSLRNLHIQAEAKAATLAEENATLKKQIEELKKPAGPK